jgi:membrane protease subunit HflC
MKRNPLTIAVGSVLLLIFALLLFVFQVRQTEIAVVTTFGKPTRPITKPGPYWKLPWPIHKVHKFDQRLHNFESKYEQNITSDQYSLLVQVYAGWKISQPEVFFPRFGSGSLAAAEKSLEEIIRTVQNSVVGRHPFAHFVSADPKELKFSEIEQEILTLAQAQCQTNGYGLEVKFLGIKRLGLPEGVTEDVFKLMQSERKVLVDKIESAGQAQAQGLRASADAESAKILATADAEATRIRSLGEAEAFKYFQVFEQNPDLANFLLSLSGLESILKERTTLILDQRTPPINLLQNLPAPESSGQPSGTSNKVEILKR